MLDFEIWKELLIEVIIKEHGRLKYDFENIEIKRKLTEYYNLRLSPDEAYYSLSKNNNITSHGNNNIVLRKNINIVSKSENYRNILRPYRRRAIFGIILLISVFFLYENYHNISKHHEEQEKLFNAYAELKEFSKKYRAIPELTFYYKGYCVWVRDYDKKYYIASLPSSYLTAEEAKNAINKLEKYYLNYKEKIYNELEEYKLSILAQISNIQKYSESIEKQEPYVTYFQKADLNNDKQLDWGEIIKFQDKVFKDFKYVNNDIVLSPKDFYFRKSGDCDDFAVFSASFIRYYNYPVYLIILENEETYKQHMVAAVYINKETYKGGYLTIKDEIIYNPKESKYEDGYAPEGNYVSLDYWKVGTPISSNNKIHLICRLEDAIASRM